MSPLLKEPQLTTPGDWCSTKEGSLFHVNTHEAKVSTFEDTDFPEGERENALIFIVSSIKVSSATYGVKCVGHRNFIECVLKFVKGTKI